ncbi:MAG TPA: FkbM family methyltransferase [bacterium]|nr:FkbM family methyltransferase [bacterium]
MRHPFLNFLKKIALAVSGHGLGQIKPIRAAYDKLFQILKPKSVMVQGHRMWLDDQDTLELATREIYEPFETALFKKELKAGQTVLDIGANIGYYTLIAAKIVGPRGKVYAFEPDPDNFALLKKNVEYNCYANVVLVNSAVSDKNKTAKLFINKTNRGDHRLYDSKDGRPSIPVQTLKLDDYFKKLDQKIHFIKMDIQGSEARALNGMKGLICKNPRLKLVTEFSPGSLKLNGQNPKNYLKTLIQLGFNLREISEKDGKLKTVEPKRLLALSDDSNVYTNLFALKQRQTKGNSDKRG